VTDADEAPAFEVEIDAATARGAYANVVMVNHTRTELTVDFAYLQPDGHALVQARVVLARATARDLVETLTSALDELDAAGA
jgi:Protein of unknown function (DUF3467)